MKPAKQSDWKNEALPEKRFNISLNRAFSAHEMELIRKGVIPEVMEDKWFIYWRDNSLYFHRSWTGYCIYVVHFVPIEDGYKMYAADLNRDPSQYSGATDEDDEQMIYYLLDLVLLQRPVPFPSDEPSPENRAAINWHEVGRAMIGQHPNNR